VGSISAAFSCQSTLSTCYCCQEVTVIRLQAAEGDGPYSQLFSYLSVRNRCGVVSSWGSQVKDLYIVPLPANSAVPSALLPFSGPGKHNVHMCRESDWER